MRMVCDRRAFRPAPIVSARWLDADGDYPAARAMWSGSMDLTKNEWLGSWHQGYEYCGIFADAALVARAAVWRYSEQAWELASVAVLPAYRRRGMAKEVCSLATARILDAGRLAMCSTRVDNVAMRRTAMAIGYCPDRDARG